ncbi:serine/threonine protein kinase [Catellatospora sp. TT07R-123]|uniref:tetratricopeptide repeat protein n=1 Tax=Catellatospora sp. TT07R-123 TaxID=2733863 RepID=UPI001B2ED9A4|nr:tetratricopeptide repeat protein [Catellatospora sp. TT07R-123]GHJ43565.1 serine/threonine protein kinase [Catellatospora sp. TT07R-123]
MTAIPRCEFEGCDSTVDETGFCEDFGHPSATATLPTPGAAGRAQRSVLWRETDRTWLVAGIAQLPILDLPAPAEAIKGPGSPSAGRECGVRGCTQKVGLSSDGRTPVSAGKCPRCNEPFSQIVLTPGELVAGRYEVLGVIGEGGLGTVYLARDNRFQNAYVALKGLLNDRHTVAAELAARERETLRLLDHPNIVRIFDAVSHPAPSGEASRYTVMEYVEGLSLENIVEQAAHGALRLPIEHVLAYGHEILTALSYLHQQGWLYCDLHPGNVMRGREGVKLIDLNGVRRHDDKTSPLVGRPGFAVEDQEAKSHGLSVQTEIVTVGNTLQKLFDVCDDSRGSAAMSVAVDSFRLLVERATHQRRERRFASAAEMAVQLVGVLREAIALRTPRERTEQSKLFDQTPLLADADMSAAPEPGRWIEHGLDVVNTIDQPPPPWVVATSLPVPVPAAGDAAADMLAQLGAPDARSLLAQLEQLEIQGHRSVEVSLRRCRAHIELDDADQAQQSLDEARNQHLSGAAGRRSDWRFDWHEGLIHTLRGDLESAAAAFGAVMSELPGEVAPKLALGLCQEATGPSAECERHLTAVWRRDRSQASAAFALARGRLIQGDRQTAVALLDEVPPISRHYVAAGVAAVRALCEPLPAGRPSPDQVRAAAARLAGLRHLDGRSERDSSRDRRPERGTSRDRQPERGDSRDRLTVVIQQAALRLIVDGITIPDRHDPVLGLHATEAEVRRRLDQSLRRLSRQAASEAGLAELVDLANSVRPVTLLTLW